MSNRNEHWPKVDFVYKHYTKNVMIDKEVLVITNRDGSNDLYEWHDNKWEFGYVFIRDMPSNPPRIVQAGPAMLPPSPPPISEAMKFHGTIEYYDPYTISFSNRRTSWYWFDQAA